MCLHHGISLEENHRFLTGRTAESVMRGNLNISASMTTTSGEVFMAPKENKENELLVKQHKLDHKVISTNSPRGSHVDIRIGTPKTGVATREKVVKNRIPCWSELISKKKSNTTLKIKSCQ